MRASYHIAIDDAAHLRVLGEEDVTSDYVRCLNDPVVHRFLVGPRSQAQTMDSVRSFVRDNLYDAASLLFGFFVHAPLRGTVRLHDITPEKAFLGLAIFDRSLWGKGWGTRCVEAVTRFARDELHISHVAAIIEPDNIASLRAFGHAGYACAADDVIRDGAVKQLWLFPAPHVRGDLRNIEKTLLNGEPMR